MSTVVRPVMTRPTWPPFSAPGGGGGGRDDCGRRTEAGVGGGCGGVRGTGGGGGGGTGGGSWVVRKAPGGLVSAGVALPLGQGMLTGLRRVEALDAVRVAAEHDSRVATARGWRRKGVVPCRRRPVWRF